MCLFFTFHFFFVGNCIICFKIYPVCRHWYSAFKSHDNNNLKRTRPRPTVTTSFQIMDLDSILHSSLRDTPQNFHLSNLFFSHPSTVPPFYSLLISFSVTKLNVTHGGEDSQIYGIKLQITLSSQEILKDVFQMMRRGWWQQ